MEKQFCTETLCPLYGKLNVKGLGPKPTFGMLIGESPGELEESSGFPFIGRSGDELTQYMTRADMAREMWYITNILKCRPDGNKDPSASMIAHCQAKLIQEIYACQPQVIAAVGGFATRFFLGPVSLEYVHGIPYRIDTLADGTKIPETTVIPCYHPALGLRKTEMMSHTQIDFYNVASALQGQITPRRLDQYKNREVDYQLITCPSEIEYADRVAIDTEWAKGQPWCITWSTGPNMARMVMADDKRMIRFLRKWWEDPEVECDIHNALYDVPVLWQLGVKPKTVVDTMVMAYLLQTEPQGLKPLSYRHLNIKMQEYMKVVAPANQAKALNYLNRVYLRSWPDPEPIERWVGGRLKPKQPSNIVKRIRNIIRDVVKGFEANDPDGVDIYKRWHGIDEEEGRGIVEELLGKMQSGDLSDIDFETAKDYACQDADVLWQLKPILWERVQALHLEDVFWTDMGIIPMISDMMVRGTKINPDHFARFSVDLNRRMDDVSARIDEVAGRHINPESWIQVLNILLERGTFKRAQSTNAKYLEKFRSTDPLVGLILDHRGLQKLDGTYAKPLPKMADVNNRVHTTIRTTRVATGRLSAKNPNLTNQPTKTEDGKTIRKGFIAEEGNIIMAADFSQVELRILAHVSRDKNMLECFMRGEDLHTKTAILIAALDNIDWNNLSEEEKYKRRYNIKRINFGISYGLSAYGLHRDLISDGINITLEECERFIEAWFNAYPGVYYWLDETKAMAKRTGMVRDLFGRIRLCPEGYAADEWIRKAGERQAINTPIQSGAQGVVKRAMVQLTPYYQAFNDNYQNEVWWPLIQIHDDIRSEVSEGMKYEIGCIKKSVMENAVKLSIPTPVEIKVGYNWKEMEVLDI